MKLIPDNGKKVPTYRELQQRCERLETCCRNMANRLAGGYRAQSNQLSDAQLVQEADVAVAQEGK
jgi:hypothetical protein